MQCATHVFRGLRSSDGRRQAPRTAQNPFNTSHLAKTYTKPYTVTHYPCPGRKSPEIQDVTISRKALKIRCPKGRPGSTPGPGTCDSSDLGRDRGGRWGRVSRTCPRSRSPPSAFARDHHAGGSRASLRGAFRRTSSSARVASPPSTARRRRFALTHHGAARRPALARSPRRPAGDRPRVRPSCQHCSSK